MRLFLSKKLIIASIVTLTFLCSSNVCLFGSHSINETVHTLSSSVHEENGRHCVTLLSVSLECDDDVPCQGAESGGEDHSHASIACNGSIRKQPLPVVVEHTFFEHPKFPVEVYLDKLIPPHIRA